MDRARDWYQHAAAATAGAKLNRHSAISGQQTSKQATNGQTVTLPNCYLHMAEKITTRLYLKESFNLVISK